MKTIRNLLVAAVCLFSAVVQLQAQGYIVPNGVTYAGTSIDGVGYGINVIYNPTTQYATGFALDPTGKTQPTTYTNTFSFNPIVDVGVRTFITSAGQAITTNVLLSGSLTELVYPSTVIINSGSVLYLALYTGNVQFAPPNGVYDNPLLGWVELQNNQGVLQMAGGAIEYGGGGIFAGTQTIIPVPEPSILALSAVGVLLFGIGRRRI